MTAVKNRLLTIYCKNKGSESIPGNILSAPHHMCTLQTLSDWCEGEWGAVCCSQSHSSGWFLYVFYNKGSLSLAAKNSSSGATNAQCKTIKRNKMLSAYRLETAVVVVPWKGMNLSLFSGTAVIPTPFLPGIGSSPRWSFSSEWRDRRQVGWGRG